MNYTDLPHWACEEVLETILWDCDELRELNPPNANDLAEKYSTKDIQELLTENDCEDLVVDWDVFLLDYWNIYPMGEA